MRPYYGDSSSALEKLILILFTATIIVGNICVFITYFIRTQQEHWSNVFILSMAFIDLTLGSFILPIRYINVYGSSSSSTFCTVLFTGEACTVAWIIYTITVMVYTYLYDLKQKSPTIRWRYLVILLSTIWFALFLFYGIPSIINSSKYLSMKPSSISNETFSCKKYMTSIYHPLWMIYVEIAMIYSFPLVCIFIGLVFLVRHLCQSRPRALDPVQRKQYFEQKKKTRHVVVLGITFIVLCLPWIIVQILIPFYDTEKIQYTSKFTYYIFIIRSALFPILYASTNSSFRVSFAIYRHRRITTNNRVWTVR